MQTSVEKEIVKPMDNSGTKIQGPRTHISEGKNDHKIAKEKQMKEGKPKKGKKGKKDKEK